MAERKSRTSSPKKRETSPSNAAIAESLQANYETVFQDYTAAKEIVDAVIGEMALILARDGALVLRGIATIRVTGVEDRECETRRRLVLRTSWAMLTKLNPSYPKTRKRKPRAIKVKEAAHA